MRIRAWLISLFGLIGLLGLFLFLPKFGRADSPTVVINELMWMGSSVSSADEWIELRNLTSSPVDISGWQLTKKSSGQEAAMLTVPAGKNIPANGYFLISNYAATSTSSVLAVEPDLVDTDVALGNSALQIKLYDAAHVLIDTADDGAGNPLAGSYASADKKYASMERNPVPGDGTQGQNWHTAASSVNFKTGAVECGTPKAENSNGQPTAEAGPDAEGVVGKAINFDGSESSDPEGQVLTYAWDFGDGRAGEGVTPAHVYSAAGEYKVMLTVSDGAYQVKDTLNATIVAAANANTNTAIQTTDNISTTKTCRGVVLDSILPNPAGSDSTEEVVIKNSADLEVDPNGCFLMAGTRKWTMKDVAVLPAGGKTAIGYATSKLRLSNAGETVKILDMNDAVLDQTTYPTAPEGRRWMNDGGTWRWDTTSAVAKNTNSKSSGAKTDEPLVELKSLTDLQALESGDQVKVTGIVTTPVGALGERLVYLTMDGVAAAAVLAEPVPKLNIGDKVTVKGKVKLSSGRRRIAAQKDGVEVVGRMEITSAKINIEDVQAEDTDKLMEIGGVIGSVSGSRFTVDDGTGEITVTLKSTTGIVRPSMNVGDNVQVVGIVQAGTTGLKILPRIKEDIKVAHVLGAAAETATETAATTSSKQTWWYWLAAGLGIVAGNGKKIWGWVKQKREK